MLLTTALLSLTLALVSTASFEPRIITGEKAGSNNYFPKFVSIRRIEDHVHFCGGTIITPSWVLTAAHCFKEFCIDCQPQDLVVVSSLCNQTQGCSTKVKSIRKGDSQPNYEPILNTDIALVQAEKPFFDVKSKSLIPRSIFDVFSELKSNVNNFAFNVGNLLKNPPDPVVIKIGRVSNNVAVRVISWDAENFSEETRNSNTFLDGLKCAAFWTTESNEFCNNNISYVCAKKLCGDCKCEGGGPVLVNDGNVDVLVGIADGHYCNPENSVRFIRLYPSRSWIMEHVGDDAKYLQF